MKRATPPHSRDRQPWSAPLAVEDVPECGIRVALAADERTRASVAELAQLRALPRLEATFDVTRRGRHGLHVVGHLSAAVGQTCVVTLDAIENDIEENIDVLFVPATPSLVEEGGESVEVVAHDAPEPLTGNTVDLGVIATEFLILAIDPYPRKSGAVFEPELADDDSGRPFAALAVLKNKSQNQDED